MYRALTATIAAGLLLAAAPSAHAAANRSFDFRTPVWTNDGQAHTWGLASFKSARRVVLTGRLNDVCPKDGYGAYLDVRVNTGTGTTRYYHAKDVGGCKDPDGIAYSFDIRINRGIRSLNLRLKECDAAKDYCGGYGFEKTVYISNPRF